MPSLLQCYEILGISPKSSLSEVKKAYRKLAKQWHPDVNQAPQAKENFIKISVAYDYIIQHYRQTEQKKKQYIYDEAIAQERARKMAELRYKIFCQQHEAYKKAYKKNVFIVSVMLITFFTGIYLFLSFQKREIILNPCYTQCKILLASPTSLGDIKIPSSYDKEAETFHIDGGGNVLVEFKIEDKIYHCFIDVSSNYKYAIADNGFPLISNDVFEMMYKCNNPLQFIILYNKPDSATLNRYLRESANKYAAKKYGTTLKEEYKDIAKCVSDKIYQYYGFEGLAQLYHNDEYFFELWSYNSVRYYFWSKKQLFKDIEHECELKK